MAILARRGCGILWSSGRKLPQLRKAEVATLHGRRGARNFTIIGAYVTPNKTLQDESVQNTKNAATIRQQSLEAIACAAAEAREKGSPVLLAGDLNVGFSEEQLRTIDGDFAEFRKTTVDQFTTQVTQEEFKIVEKWKLHLANNFQTDGCATHAGKILQQAWSTDVWRASCSKLDTPRDANNKRMSDHQPMLVKWKMLEGSSSTASNDASETAPCKTKKIKFDKWDDKDKLRYNWLITNSAIKHTRDLEECGAELVKCAQQVEDERIKASKTSAEREFWNEELKETRKKLRKIRKVDRNSKERRKLAKCLKNLMQRRALELGQTTAVRWAAGLHKHSKVNWKDIKTEKLMQETGLCAPSVDVLAGSLTSYKGPDILLSGPAAAEEAGKYAARLNAQSWEEEGLEFNQDFAVLYSALQGWKGTVLDKKAQTAASDAPDAPMLELSNRDFTLAEIDITINRTKTNKSAGSDETKNENFRCMDVMARSAICRLFSELFDSFEPHGEVVGRLPTSWKNSVVAFLDKSSTKDTRVLKQKRGIRLLSHFGKLFRGVLAQRLRVITSSLLRDSQALKTNEGCTTNTLILTQKVGERIEQNQQTVAVFIDLVKAFDTVNRRLLWARFRSLGICGKLFWALKAGYDECTLQGRVGGFLSAAFRDEGNGVRQGDVDSSDAFALFIDDLDREIEIEEQKVGRKLGIPLVGNNDVAQGDRVAVLKHADDTVLLATCVEDMQLLMKAVHRWCTKWQISPNPDKCAVMFFVPKNAKAKDKNVPITLLGKLLKIVESTVYLGYTLHSSGHWKIHIDGRLSKARAWDGIATSLIGSAGGATAAVAADVRGAAAEVGVLYGAELWASPTNPENANIDSAQASVAKEILRVRSTTEAAGVLTELGWTATSVKAWRQRLLFWWRLGRTKSELLRTLEWQAKEQNQNSRSANPCEYNWWRDTQEQLKNRCRTYAEKRN